MIWMANDQDRILFENRFLKGSSFLQGEEGEKETFCSPLRVPPGINPGQFLFEDYMDGSNENSIKELEPLAIHRSLENP